MLLAWSLLVVRVGACVFAELQTPCCALHHCSASLMLPLHPTQASDRLMFGRLPRSLPPAWAVEPCAGPTLLGLGQQQRQQGAGQMAVALYPGHRAAVAAGAGG
ncbi:hypothetical protein V8C86DRAFT_2476441 [Haematococcus lacustris]